MGLGVVPIGEQRADGGEQHQRLVEHRVVSGLGQFDDRCHATERLVAQHLAGRLTSKNDGGDGKAPKPVDHFMRDLQDRFRQRFSTNVNIVHGDKKGRIEIEYYGNEDLDRILQLLGLPSE